MNKQLQVAHFPIFLHTLQWGERGGTPINKKQKNTYKVVW